MTDDTPLPDGWTACTDGSPFEIELARELSKGHPLYGVTLRAVARRGDRDDVLFRTPANGFVVVHLTWRRAERPPWPNIVWQSPVAEVSAFANWSTGHYEAID
jgi:hypothetical protein